MKITMIMETQEIFPPYTVDTQFIGRRVFIIGGVTYSRGNFMFVNVMFMFL